MTLSSRCRAVALALLAVLAIVAPTQAQQPRPNAPVFTAGHWVYADQRPAPRAITLLASDAIGWWRARGFSACAHPVLWTAPDLWQPGDPGSPASGTIYSRGELNGCHVWIARWLTYYLRQYNYDGLRVVCRSVYHEMGHTAGVEHLARRNRPDVVLYHGRRLGGEVAGLMSGQTGVVACNRWARRRR